MPRLQKQARDGKRGSDLAQGKWRGKEGLHRPRLAGPAEAFLHTDGPRDVDIGESGVLQSFYFAEDWVGGLSIAILFYSTCIAASPCMPACLV